jgi:hypothetical protein
MLFKRFSCVITCSMVCLHICEQLALDAAAAETRVRIEAEVRTRSLLTMAAS